MRYKLLMMLAIVCVMLSGCGKGSTSFKDEYNANKAQEEFNQKADRVKDEVTSEVDNAKEQVQARDAQIREEAGKTSKEIDKTGKKEFQKGIEKMDEWANTGMSSSQLVWYYLLKAYYFINEISMSLIGICWFAGVILFILFFGNKGMQQFAVFGLGIGIPTVLLLIRYVVPWMVTLFGNH